MGMYGIAETYKYDGDLTPQMIWDQQAIGIQDLKLSECLQMDPNLTLVKAKRLISWSEAVQEHQTILQQATNSLASGWTDLLQCN